MNKTVLITRASSGIGKATTKLFQAEGWNVIATIRPPKEEELNQLDNILVSRLDVLNLDLDLDSIDQAIKAGIEKIDVLVNNAEYGAYGRLEEK